MNKNGISKEDISYYDIAARSCGLSIPAEHLERLIHCINGVRKHKGAFSVKHFAKIDAFIDRKYNRDSVTLKDDRNSAVDNSIPLPDLSGKKDKVEGDDTDNSELDQGT
jgi:hypothetical protein